MIAKANERYTFVQKRLETDAEYLALEERHREQYREFQELMQSLTEEQRQVVTEFVGICAELDERALEIACFAP